MHSRRRSCRADRPQAGRPFASLEARRCQGSLDRWIKVLARPQHAVMPGTVTSLTFRCPFGW
ncbi:MAG: hypothetical protein AVDCRST_MAG31-2622 [uncultured Sphingomonas sp.]|uniref:Uncharacterized protein n=1 Tax=uncultured Sphingomonas sp. TaxID=158754 RepID=A0A6J4TWS9_9SPHN|nr:MAG: hypothetical protein AVDCRST_MAG31-2622 [uncultured Sphingomonas sp.]